MDWWQEEDPERTPLLLRSESLYRTFDKAVRDYSPDIFVTSHFAGLAGEVTHMLPFLRESGCKCVLALRDIYNVAEFLRYPGPSFSEHLDCYYSRVLVFGTPKTSQWLPLSGLSGSANSKVTFMGYIPPCSPWVSKRTSNPDDVPHIICQVGGGIDGYLVAEAVASACHRLRLELNRDLHLTVACGPLMSTDDRLRLSRWQNEGTRVVRWLRGMGTEAFGSSVFQVSMGGYNSCAEAGWLGRETLLVPRARAGDMEQELRAELFSRLFPQISTTALFPTASLRMRIVSMVAEWVVRGRFVGSRQNDALFADPAMTRSQLFERM